MISASSTVTNILEQYTTIKQGLGCSIELNMNSLVDNITVSGSEYVAADGSKPFKKLFPIDSIIKPFRPIGAGVKYGVNGDIAQGSYANPAAIQYGLNYRTYYPGTNTYYKYWISPKGQGANITITYPQAILTNKIVVKFEISHSIPETWTIYKEGNVQLATGTSSNIKSFTTGNNKNYDAGTLTLYYNGTGWTTTQPTTIQSPVSITSLRLNTSGVSNSYIGVIELSPRWVSDLSDRLVSFNISKESSTSADDILPVGKVSANSLSMELASWENPRILSSYSKPEAFSSSKVYLYKQAILYPYYKIYYSGAPLTDSKGEYEKISQGVFYIDNWTTSEYGDVSLTALDGAKYLQETIAPNIFCEDFSATAIIRRLLDGIGFTNYNINIKKDNTGTITDTSIFSPKYWWTDDSKTVWNAIQEICRDSQMVALFDENNILQFYTRDYIFDNTRSVNWSFRYDANGTLLPNIMSFEKQDLATANQIKILWRTQNASQELGNAQPLWKAEDSFIGAFSLDQNLLTTDQAGSYLYITPVVVNQKENQVLYSYSGFLVIDSEIIEYDAIQYQYLSKSGSIKYIDVTGVSDLQKIYSDIQQTTNPDQMLRQSGKVKIKSRGAFGTTVTNHYANASDILSSWSGYEVSWGA